MKPRTPAEVGVVLRERRDRLGLSQEDIDGLSSATVRKIENATQDAFKPRTLTLLLSGLGLASDAYARLLAGEPEGAVLAPVSWSAADGGLPPVALARWVERRVEVEPITAELVAAEWGVTVDVAALALESLRAA